MKPLNEQLKFFSKFSFFLSIILFFRGFKVKSTYFVLRDTYFAIWRKLGFGGGEGLRKPEPFKNYKGPIGADRDQMYPKNQENLAK